VITDRDPGDEDEFPIHYYGDPNTWDTEPPDPHKGETSSAKPCQFCGSLACEWADDTQLGCTDCGYDAPDPTNLNTLIESGSADLYRDMRRGK
jgi:hypothetical protein